MLLEMHGKPVRRLVLVADHDQHRLADQKKLKAPLDYSKYVYTDLLKAVRPQNVQITALPASK